MFTFANIDHITWFLAQRFILYRFSFLSSAVKLRFKDLTQRIETLQLQKRKRNPLPLKSKTLLTNEEDGIPKTIRNREGPIPLTKYNQTKTLLFL